MALRAGFHGTVGQPSAQVIDGSLKFDESKNQYLKELFCWKSKDLDLECLGKKNCVFPRT